MSGVTSTEILNSRSFGVLDTPEVTLPPAQADAHRGTIDGLTVENFESGSTGIKIALSSLDQSGVSENYMLFPPKEFVEDIHLDPSALSDIPAEGKKQSPKQRYGQVIANSNKTGEVQRLIEIGFDAKGADALDGVSAPEDFEQYVQLLSSLLTGVVVVFMRKPDESEGTDPQFRGRLKVSGIFKEADVVNNPKRLKTYLKRWQEQ